MKIICFIDNLNPGGAQRQICYLSKLLKQKGHDITILTYHNDNFFLDEITNNKINYISINNKKKIFTLFKVIQFIRKGDHDIVISYLRNPVLLSEISSIGKRKWKLIVSERNAYIKNDFFKLFFRRIFHIFADYIVVNSNTNKKLLNKNAPWLKNVATIYNYVDLNYFKPMAFELPKKDILLLGVGKYSHQKNINNLVEAIKICKNMDLSISIKLNWFGDTLKDQSKNKLIIQLKNKIKEYKLENDINLFPATKNIIDQYRKSSALILPSLYEGLPNVACEAMSSGLPLLLSNVCDNVNLVDDNKNGYLFDPLNPRDIADKIVLFANLEQSERNNMGLFSRKKSLDIFSEENFIDQYSEIISIINQK